MTLNQITNTVRTITRIPSVECSTVKTPLMKNILRPQKGTIDSLPVELISEIFSQFINETHCTRIYAPIILSQVCALWRRIVHGTSNLWTSVLLIFPYTELELERMRTGIRLSQRCPLDIHLDLRDQEWEWDDSAHEIQADDMFQIFDLASRAAERWRSFEILTDNWQPIHAFLALSTKLTSLPSLERLVLYRCNAYFGIPGIDFAPSELGQPIELFGGDANFPKLREVIFGGVHVNWACCGVKNLRELEFKYIAPNVAPTMDEFTRIVRASPNLESFSLISCIPRSDLPSESLLFLPSLKRFSFGWAKMEDGVRLLGMFQLPAVEELSLLDVLASLHDPDAENSSSVIEALISFCNPTISPDAHLPSVTRRGYFSLARLRFLSLDAVQVNLTTYLLLLEMTSNLEELELLGMEVGYARPFAIDRFPLCPKLKKLSIRPSYETSAAEVLESIKRARPEMEVEELT